MNRVVQTDVAVVGGGPAGTATAITLLQAGLRVTLVEQARRKDFRVGETVPPDIQPALCRLGAWEMFRHDRHLPSAGICSAWGEPDLAFCDALTQPLGAGWHLDRRRFDANLIEVARRRGVSLLTGSRAMVTDAEYSGAWRLTFAHHDGRRRELTTTFVVDATGRAASLARHWGARRVRADLLVALCAVVDLPREEAHPGYTLVEAVDIGWWYVARVPVGRAVIALFTDPDLVRRHTLSRPEVWRALLDQTRHAGASVDGVPTPSKIYGAAAGSHCLNRVAGNGWLAVGDAATAWDPLTSAGIVHALRSGVEAASAIVHALDGDAAALQGYERDVQRRYTRCLLERRSYYGLETRWPASPFWNRRRLGPTQIPA